MSHMEGQDLTKGPIGKQLWSLAWPLMLSVFFYTLYNIVDAFWVSKLSPEAIAAVSVSQISLFIMVALSMGITVGSGVIMAMHIGAKDKKEAERVLGQSFVLSGIAGVFFTAVSLAFRSQILIASGASGLIFAPALEYFTITAAGSLLLFMLITVMFAFNSQGDTFTLTKLFALSTLVNLVLDPLMIFGYAGFPAMGISGAAIATLISQAVFIVIALRSLSSSHRMIRFRFSNLTVRWESVKKILTIGIPASLTQVINPIGLAGLMFITALGFSEPGVIAFSLGFRVEFFAFLPAIGFGFGAMAMIGQNIGAGNIQRAKDCFRKALRYGALAAAGLGVLAILFAGPLIRLFTADPEVTGYAFSYLWTVALSYGFLAAMMVEASAFQAIGRSWPGFWIFFLRFVVISIPLSYLLTQVFHFPILALWASIVAGNVLSAAAGYAWISRTLKHIQMKEVPVHA
ncbi:MAG: MATE family efflux transporter [Candidatus Wildermuthbacteria bacterium]|nr:MATE family efflux transporter [Candidatus Wildermuthbacteria bacterium]